MYKKEILHIRSGDFVIFRAKPSTTRLSEAKNKVPKVFNDFRDFKEYLMLFTLPKLSLRATALRSAILD